MNSGSGSIQPQVELSNSALLTKKMMTRFLQVCLDDDVQPMAAVAMSSVGDLLEVSPQQIEEAQKLFRSAVSGKSPWTTRKFMEALGTIAGLPSHGWPEALVESISLTKTFLLATACKVCFTQEETGRILYEMMWLGSQAPKIAFHTDHASNFVGAILGYSDRLVPFDHYTSLVNQVKDHHPDPTQLGVLYERLPPGIIGRILVHVFEALRDNEISQVTLEGGQNGNWLAAALSWLLPNEVVCSLGNEVIFGSYGSRLSIRLMSQPHWKIGLWKEEKQIDLIQTSLSENAPLEKSLNSHIPCEAAMADIAQSTHFRHPNRAFLNATGALAAALVDVAYSKGMLYSERCKQTEELKAVCSRTFVSSHGNSIHRYGWSMSRHDEESSRVFVQQRESCVRTLSSLVENRTPRASGYGDAVVDKLCGEIFELNRRHYDATGKPMLLPTVDDCGDILRPAIYVAGEALLECFAEASSGARVFRPYQYGRLEQHALMLFQMFFRRTQSDMGGKLQEILGYPFSKLWDEALKSSLPGDQQVHPGSLAIAGEGYVAYAKLLESVSTNKKGASVIVTVPGILCHSQNKQNSSVRARRLMEVTPTESTTSRLVHDRLDLLSYDLSGQRGLRALVPREDENDAEITHLVERSGSRTLRLSTLLRMHISLRGPGVGQGIIVPLSTSPINYVPLSWRVAMEAVATANHVHSGDSNLIRAEAEPDIVDDWRKEGMLNKIAWHEAGRLMHAKEHSLAATASDEQLRFFEAGYLGQEAKLFVRHNASLVACMALAGEMDLTLPEYRWAVLV